MTAGPKASRRCCAQLAALVVCVAACTGGSAPPDAGEQEASAPPAPEWMSRAELHVERTQPAFDDNTEVFLKIANRSESDIVIENLQVPGAAVLLHEGGTTAKIHAISVGVKKPILVVAGAVKATSLLFEAAAGTPREMRLYGRVFPVPP